jgi:ribosome-associated translation inhibitor RaiA
MIVNGVARGFEPSTRDAASVAARTHRNESHPLDGQLVRPQTNAEAEGDDAVVDVSNGRNVYIRRGPVSSDAVAYAMKRLGRVIDRVAEPVQFVRTKLTVAPDPARRRPALAEVTVDINGDVVRAHVAAAEMHEAIDLLQRRLRDQLEHRAERRQALHRFGATAHHPGRWRHGRLAALRPEYLQRPADDRQLVRHKTVALDEISVEDAAFQLDQLDYDFLLFRLPGTGADAVLHRTGGRELRLSSLRPPEVQATTSEHSIEIDQGTPPTLTVADAVDMLDASRQQFVFFANTVTGRGNVVYRRYDGNYGLITPE